MLCCLCVKIIKIIDICLFREIVGGCSGKKILSKI